MAITKDSTQLRTSRYMQGGVTEVGVTGIEWWEKKKIQPSVTDIPYTVEKFYEGRLDKIAYAFYGEMRYWWVIAQHNGILDPVTEIVEGAFLLIPTMDRIRAEILTGKPGGVDSKRTERPQITPIIT